MILSQAADLSPGALDRLVQFQGLAQQRCRVVVEGARFSHPHVARALDTSDLPSSGNRQHRFKPGGAAEDRRFPLAIPDRTSQYTVCPECSGFPSQTRPTLSPEIPFLLSHKPLWPAPSLAPRQAARIPQAVCLPPHSIPPQPGSRCVNSQRVGTVFAFCIHHLSPAPKLPNAGRKAVKAAASW